MCPFHRVRARYSIYKNSAYILPSFLYAAPGSWSLVHGGPVMVPCRCMELCRPYSHGLAHSPPRHSLHDRGLRPDLPLRCRPLHLPCEYIQSRCVTWKMRIFIIGFSVRKARGQRASSIRSRVAFNHRPSLKNALFPRRNSGHQKARGSNTCQSPGEVLPQ